MTIKRKSYNERLFNGSFVRKFFQFSRFIWIKQTIEKYRIHYNSIIELGCFDGRIFDYLPYEAEKYQGYDANWEGG